MTPMKWLRKNSKKILALICVPIMVIFILPSFSNWGNQSRINPVLGTFSGQAGQKIEVTASQLRACANFIGAMSELGIGFLSQVAGSQPPVFSQIGELGGVGAFPVLATNLLFFSSESAYADEVRQDLHQQILNLVDDKEELDRVVLYIDELTTAKEGELCFLLLAAEAQNMGIMATDQQIDTIINVRKQLVAGGKLPGSIEIQPILDRHEITYNEFRKALGEYIAVLRYGHLVTNSSGLSERQLRKVFRDGMEWSTVAGTFVSFESRLFDEKIGAPSEEDIQQQFEAYKRLEPVESDDENPFGFGYFLPNRVQVEYLSVDLAEAEKIVTDEFAQLSAPEQEDVFQEYWAAHKEDKEFRVAIPKPQDAEGEPSEASAQEYRYLEFDEAVGKVRVLRHRETAMGKVELLLAEARNLAQSKSAPMKSVELGGLAKDVADYSVISKRFSTDKLAVTYGQTEFFSQQEVGKIEQFGSTYRMLKNADNEPLSGILFGCEPLHKGMVGRFDMPPAQLYEDMTPLFAVDFAGKAKVGYMLRIVGVDKQREALSPADDGRQGAAEKSPLAESRLRKKIEEDWKSLQAFNMAKVQAQAFAQQGLSDWEVALAKANESLKKGDDPNQPEPLRTEELGAVRKQLEQYTELVRKNPSLSSYLLGQIVRSSSMLKKSMQLAQQIEVDQTITGDALPVLELPGELSCLVFKQLEVSSPNQEEYLRNKPLVAAEILRRNQILMTLSHFNPQNIMKRSHWAKIEVDDSDAKPEEVDE